MSQSLRYGSRGLEAPRYSPDRPSRSFTGGTPGNALSSHLEAGGAGSFGATPGQALVPLNESAAAGTFAETRASTVHHQLLVAEREISELREEAAIRGAELEALRTALQREHETSLRLQSKHSQDLDHMRVEYERQNSQLIEQLTVLKGVSDTAMAEKRRISEDSQKNKAQLDRLLEREREEKSQLMADYRSQTEALITEQGREITGLRNLLEAAREEEEKLIAAAKRQEERRNEAEEALLKIETQLSEERVGQQRRQREIEQRHQSQLDALRHQNEMDLNELRAGLIKANGAKEQAEDQVRSLTERLRLLELNSDTERTRLREAYETDVETLQQELRAVKTTKETLEMTLRAEIERAQHSHEEVVLQLRRDVESARHERQAAFDESRVQKEIIVAEHARRVSELQSAADHARRELQEERSLRKESDSDRQKAQMENDALKNNLQRVSLELENVRLDARTRERNAEQEYLASEEKLKNTVRTLESDLGKVRSALQRAEVESNRLHDEQRSKLVQLETDLMDARRKNESLRITAEDAVAQRNEENAHATQQIDTLQSRKATLEAEVSRLDRALSESESRNVATTKQLTSERKALEACINESQSLKLRIGELNSEIENEKSKVTDLLQDVAEKDSEILRCREAISDLNGHIRAAQQEAEGLKAELSEQRRRLEEALAESKAVHRRDVMTLEEQLNQAKRQGKSHQEAHQAAEEQLKVLRDEVIRAERLAIEKDESHQEAIRHMRRDHEEELLRMDTVVNTLRDDLARSQHQKNQAQREALDATRDTDRRVAIVQEALEAERATKQRLHDELRAKEQLIAEVQGTVRLLQTRLASKEEDLRRLESEVRDCTEKVHDAHSVLGKKDAAIGQLMAKLKVYESRGSL